MVCYLSHGNHCELVSHHILLFKKSATCDWLKSGQENKSFKYTNSAKLISSIHICISVYRLPLSAHFYSHSAFILDGKMARLLLLLVFLTE